MAIPMKSFSGGLADLQDHLAGTIFDQAISAERRSKVRYPLNLSVRFRSLSVSPGFSGVGRTVNLSSSGILVFFEHIALDEIRVGAALQMSIEWPSLLDDRIPLQLFAAGRILRLDSSTFAAALDRHQFRTMSVRDNRQPTRNATKSRLGEAQGD